MARVELVALQATGPRELDLEPGSVESGTITVQRNGQMITVVFSNVLLTPGVGGLLLASLPTGFHAIRGYPEFHEVYTGAAASPTGIHKVYVAGSSISWGRNDDGTQTRPNAILTGAFCFPTAQPWPT